MTKNTEEKQPRKKRTTKPKPIVAEPKEKGITRQIEFETTLYGNINQLTENENNRRKLFLRSNRIHIQDMIPSLVEEGLRYRKGEIFTPDDKEYVFSNDDQWLKLKAKAQIAMREFIEYQNLLMSKD